MDDLTHFDLEHIDFEIFRKIFGQTLNFDIRCLLLNHASSQFDPSALLFINKVQWHIHLNRLIHADAKEVGVHGKAFCGVTLDILDDGVFRLTTHLNFENGTEAGFVFQHMLEILADQRQALGGLIRPVNDGGHFSLETTQAAARTFPRVGSRLCNNNKVRHGLAPFLAPLCLRPTRWWVGKTLLRTNQTVR